MKLVTFRALATRGSGIKGYGLPETERILAEFGVVRQNIFSFALDRFGVVRHTRIMTRQEVQNALATGFNKQGRTVSEAMRAKYLIAMTPSKPEFKSFEYRGFKVEGGNGRYFIAGMPHTITTSVQKSKEAIDRLLEIRAELAEELA